MKKLGLVGGMGPESTLPYYSGIVYGVQKKLGRNEFPPLTIESVDVFKVLGLCGAQRYDELLQYLLAAVQNLAAAGAQFAALSANTPHIVFDELQRRSPLPLVSIIQATCNEAKRQGFTKLGLLGTAFTMDGTFFTAPFTSSGINVVTPTAEEKQYIGCKIADELELGVVKPETRQQFLTIIDRMQRQQGIEAVVLGCTELPLLFQGTLLPLACLDTMQIHINSLVRYILEEEAL